MRDWLVQRAGVPLAVLLLLALFALRLTDAADRNALTFDEPHYIGTGLYLWDSGDYHYARTLFFHPPLAYHLASLPLLFMDREDVAIDSKISQRLRSGEISSPEWVRWVSRLPFVVLACWGALLLFLWGREVAGASAGLFAVALFTLSPVMLGHAFLAHSDITVAVLFLQTLYAFWRWLEKPVAMRLIVCGLSLGLALISKLSALLLIPALGLLLLCREYGVWPRSPLSATERSIPKTSGLLGPGFRATGWLVVLGLLAVCVIWLGYGGSFAMSEGTWSGSDPMQLPAYLNSLSFDVAANARGRSIYFFGQLGDQGEFWYLLPVAWLLKTPIPSLLLIAWALASRSSQARLSARRIGGLVVVSLGVYLTVAMFWLRVPLGVRYLLPILPLIDLFVATRLAPITGRRGLAAVSLLLWMALAGAWVHPHYLAFFNPLVGGPGPAHRALVESNYDWGQALPALAEELERRGNPTVWLAYFGNELPSRYGISSKRLPACQPVTGTVAISATLLRGLYSLDNPFERAPDDCFDWLLQYEPVAQPGYAILLYEISEEGSPSP